MSSSLDGGIEGHNVTGTELQTRGYQYEMFEKSMKGNVIIAMDTGSGKTHIAILRMAAELERCPPEKFAWFLAPTVALCTQQHEFIASQLPAIKTKLLLGSDNVDHWGEGRIWDAVLKSVRIVVSTPAILRDALTHGYVKMKSLALLVFDEAHNCIKDSPANGIMRHYHREKSENGTTTIPHILGLSASPIIRSKLADLNVIESNLDAISITPRLHREELLRYVHRPVFHRLQYIPSNSQQHLSVLSLSTSSADLILNKLSDLYHSMDENTQLFPSSQSNGMDTDYFKHDVITRKLKQLKRFIQRANIIYEELGRWALDYFIRESLDSLRNGNDIKFNFGQKWQDIRAELLQLLESHILPLLERRSSSEMMVSCKVQQLVEFLTNKDENECSGLVFVQQRATVAVLTALLSQHPATRYRFKCATFVGFSNSGNRRYDMDQLLDLKIQQKTLAEFRARKKNLVIATDVLEEGIDVTACNLVICFDPPKNLKSFIQRRGRARQERSEYVIMCSQNDTKIDQWESLEQEMIERYQDDQRGVQHLRTKEEFEEENDDIIEVKSTGALLTAKSAMAHLYHFCSILPQTSEVDNRPQFSFQDGESGKVSAEVRLPSCLTIRVVKSRTSWETERAAKKDAAFQAYRALFNAGLLNDNLLPLTQEWNKEQQEQMVYLPSMLNVAAQFNPFRQLGQAWAQPNIHQTRLTLRRLENGKVDEFVMTIITPQATFSQDLPHFELHWDAETLFMVHIDPSQQSDCAAPLSTLREITHLLYRSTHGNKLANNDKDYVLLFAPELPDGNLSTWLQSVNFKSNALDLFKNGKMLDGFIRTSLSFNNPQQFCQWHVADDGTVSIECRPLLRRRNFLSLQPVSSKDTRKPEILLAADCTIDALPFNYAQLSLLIPAITRHIEAQIVAEHVCKTILSGISIININNIITAVTAPSAGWITNYERYEFIGDSVLKFATSLQLYVDYPNWPEGYLTQKKSVLVSNENLAKAALEKGLDFYIMTAGEKERKWRPLLVSDNAQPESRQLSKKVLADVVEALIGACFVESGFQRAFECINRFIPEVRHTQPQFINPVEGLQSGYIESLKAEELIGYHFKRKEVLIEALTHPSCNVDIRIQSYQRLEFLGDAVLDMLIAEDLMERRPEFTPKQMTQVKHCLVNSDLLGFICLNYQMVRDEGFQINPSCGVYKAEPIAGFIQIWKYMHSQSPAVIDLQRECLKRFEHHHKEILEELEGSRFPWARLAQFGPEKFYSDIIESIIGAIFVDSGGDLEPCRRFIDRIELTRVAKYIIEGDVDVTHPKNALQQLVHSSKVDYTVEHGEEPGQLKCKVLIDGCEITEIQGYLKRDAAITVAAESALNVIAKG